MTFFLLALLSYLFYRARGWAGGRAFYIASLVAFVLALLSKSVAVILPVVLLTHDLCFVQQESRRRWLLDKLPYLAAAAAVALLTIMSQAPLSGGRAGYHGGSPYTTFLTMLPVLLRYLYLLVWPADLSALYMPEVKTGVDLAVASAALVLLLLCCLAVYLWHRQRTLLFWLALFFIGLLPVAQIVPLVTLMNDRYLYFPMLGVAGLVGGGAALVSCRLQGKAKNIFATVVCLLLLPLPYITMKRVAVWHDALTLWSETARKVPDCHVAWSNLGEAYQQASNRDAAFQAYLNALAIDPEYREPLENIASIYMGRGEPLKARPFLFKLVASWPDYAAGFVTLGNNYYLTGEFKEAQQAYLLALQKQPASRLALVSLARLHLRLGDPATARFYYQKGVSGGVADPAVAYVAATVAALDGRQPAALHYLEIALQLGFNDFDQLRNDHDLDPLRATAEFKQLVRRYSSERTLK
jgi:Flp pilus assembly protein TadD